MKRASPPQLSPRHVSAIGRILCAEHRTDYGLRLQTGTHWRVSLSLFMRLISSCFSLVERFDIESYSDFSAKSSNFRGLVLRCIKADFCDQILIFQHFARSRRYAILCTAQISKFQQKVGKNNSWFFEFFQMSAKNRHFFTRFIEFCIDVRISLNLIRLRSLQIRSSRIAGI